MIFEKDVDALLPYDREQYLNFLDDDSIPLLKWYGVSIQLDSDKKNVDLIRYIDIYEPLCKSLILEFGDDLNWIVNLEDKNFEWFPNSENNLCDLRSLFRQSNISLGYTGGVVFSKEDLLQYTKDLIQYPYVLLNKPGKLYRNINISHERLPFLIRTTGHLDIDVLSTDMGLLKEFENSYFQHPFIIRKYRGTSF